MAEIIPDECKHETFQCDCKVGRLHKDGHPEEITEWRLDVTVHCTRCFKPFVFIGLPGGYHPDKPTVSIEGLEARLVLKPLS